MKTELMEQAIEMLCPIDGGDRQQTVSIVTWLVDCYRQALEHEHQASPERLRPASRKALNHLTKLISQLQEMPSHFVPGEVEQALQQLTAMREPLQRALNTIDTPGKQGNAKLWARRELIQQCMFTLLRLGLPSGSKKIMDLAMLVHGIATGEPPPDEGQTSGNWKRLAEDMRAHFNRMLEEETEAQVPFARDWPTLQKIPN